MKNCSSCKYSCERDWGNYSPYGMSADCDLTCMYDSKTEMYVNNKMICKHYDTSKGWDWSKRRKREYPIEHIKD